MPNYSYPLLGLLHLIVWIWAIVDILKSGKSVGEKLLWILVVLLLPLIGLILYILIGRGK
ncbi:MAG TPA: PLDc N-terminal domain-containing protein [Phycisphaerales bacterium]|nr:PLDc N-terminal domain-containing protein [Phycisphaerales bacterium]